MPWTTEQRAALAEAISSGIQTVRYDDRQVTYQTLADMRRVLADMDAELSAVESTVFAVFSRD